MAQSLVDSKNGHSYLLSQKNRQYHSRIRPKRKRSCILYPRPTRQSQVRLISTINWLWQWNVVPSKWTRCKHWTNNWLCIFLLNYNYSVSTNFAYAPRAKALSPLASRLAAYSVGKGVPGPDTDVEGWKVFSSTAIKGTLFEAKSISVDCTVRAPSLAQCFKRLNFILVCCRSSSQEITLFNITGN